METGGAIVQGVKNLLPPEVTDPRKLLQQQKEALEDVQDHWHDFERREYSWASKGLLVLAVLQILAVIVYDVALNEFVHCAKCDTTPNQVRREYMSVCFVIIEMFQAFLCVNGVIFENLPMLLLANINAIVVVIRMALNINATTQEVVWITPLAVSAALSALTVVFSLFAGMKFGRLVFFTVASDEAIIRLYRFYQLAQAVVAVDLQCAFVTLVTSFFFEEELGEWDYVLASALVLFVFIAALSIVWHIRKENLVPCIVFIFLSLSFLPYAFYATTPFLVGKNSNYAESATLAKLAIASMCFFRGFMIFCIMMCMANFGKGLKGALENRRAKPMKYGSEKLFLQQNEDSPQSASALDITSSNGKDKE